MRELPAPFVLHPASGAWLCLWPGPYPPPAVEGWLTEPELARADRYLDPQKGRAFAGFRSWMRSHLAAALDWPPGRLAFVNDEHGRPNLTGELGQRWSFNLSHSAGCALLALLEGRGRRVGVDIEVQRDVMLPQGWTLRDWVRAEARWKADPVQPELSRCWDLALDADWVAALAIAETSS